MSENSDDRARLCDLKTARLIEAFAATYGLTSEATTAMATLVKDIILDRLWEIEEQIAEIRVGLANAPLTNESDAPVDHASSWEELDEAP